MENDLETPKIPESDNTKDDSQIEKNKPPLNNEKKNIRKVSKAASTMVSLALLAHGASSMNKNNIEPDNIEPELPSNVDTSRAEVFNKESEINIPYGSYEYIPSVNNIMYRVLEEGGNETETKVAKLDLTKEWSSDREYIEAQNGEVEIDIALFLDKSTEYNYDVGEAPDGNSVLVWNATEAAMRFGQVILYPGDKMSFTERIGFGDLIPKKVLLEDQKDKENFRVMTKLMRRLPQGERKRESPTRYMSSITHGDGYIKYGNGACFTASTFGEAFGLSLVNDEGKKIPLFKGDVGSIQAHSISADPEYYTYLYHGPGVGINTSPYGRLEFQLNPNLPDTVIVTLEMDINDTNPDSPTEGIFSPVVKVHISGIPDEWSTVESIRLSAHRKEVLKNVTGRNW